MQVYNHWGPVDETKTLPIERINELFGSMASYYKLPTEEVRSARAVAEHVQRSTINFNNLIVHLQAPSTAMLIASAMALAL